MATLFKFNPFTGTFDMVGSSTTPGPQFDIDKVLTEIDNVVFRNGIVTGNPAGTVQNDMGQILVEG